MRVSTISPYQQNSGNKYYLTKNITNIQNNYVSHKGLKGTLTGGAIGGGASVLITSILGSGWEVVSVVSAIAAVLIGALGHFVERFNKEDNKITKDPNNVK